MSRRRAAAQTPRHEPQQASAVDGPAADTPAADTPVADTPAVGAPAAGENEELQFSPDRSVGFALKETYRAFARSLLPRIQRHGVSLSMWFVLRVLWEEDGLTQAEVARRTGVNGPSTVHAINALERHRLVERRRNRQDRRLTNVWLTPAGQELKPAIRPVALEVNRIGLRGIPPDKAEELLAMLALIRTNLAEDAAGPLAALATGRDEFE